MPWAATQEAAQVKSIGINERGSPTRSVGDAICTAGFAKERYESRQQREWTPSRAAPIIAPQARSCLVIQQDRHCLPIGGLSPGLELRQGATPDRVLDHQERVVRQSQDTGDIPCRDLERFGTEHHRALAKLLERNPVVQTAR